MSSLWFCTLFTLLTVSCSTTENKNEALYDAIEANNLPKIKELVGDGDLEGQSELHNLLVLNSCNLKNNNTNEDIAEFLISKGAQPVEKELNHPKIDSFGIRGPIAVTLDGPNCAPLLKYYVDHMSPEDVANGALAYQSMTSSKIYDINVGTPEQNAYWVDWYVQNSLGIYQNQYVLFLKNEEHCKAGNRLNCKASNHIRSENIEYHQTIRRIAFVEACEAYRNLRSEENLMKKQLEFGKATGVASPKTYDAHARQAQVEQDDLLFYRTVIKTETGRDFNPSSCPR